MFGLAFAQTSNRWGRRRVIALYARTGGPAGLDKSIFMPHNGDAARLCEPPPGASPRCRSGFLGLGSWVLRPGIRVRVRSVIPGSCLLSPASCLLFFARVCAMTRICRSESLGLGAAMALQIARTVVGGRTVYPKGEAS